MSTHVLLLVLAAALLHATWNALLHSGQDRLWQMTVMSIPTALIPAVAVWFLPWPAPESWSYLLPSAALQVAYSYCLVAAYRVGDFTQSYPIARGSAPLLVTLGAALFAHEYIGPGASLGIVLVCAGVIALAFKGRRFSSASIPAAFGTSCCIAGYTVLDGIGVRLSGNNFAYTAWIYLLWGTAMIALFIASRGTAALRAPRREFTKGIVGGLASMVGYAVIVWALQYGAMGPIAALRETSVLFGAAIAWRFMNEHVSRRRWLACGAVAIGAMMLKIG